MSSILPSKNVQDGQQIVTVDGILYEFNLETNSWINKGFLHTPSIVNEEKDGFITPEIQRKLQLIKTLKERGIDFNSFKIDIEDKEIIPYFYFFHSSDRLIKFIPEDVNKLRIEVDKARLYQKVISNCCVGPKGVKGDDGPKGPTGMAAENEISLDSIRNTNGDFVIDVIVKLSIDTDISLRFFKNNNKIVEISLDISNIQEESDQSSSESSGGTENQLFVNQQEEDDSSVQLSVSEIIIEDENVYSVPVTSIDLSYSIESERLFGTISIEASEEDLEGLIYKARQRGPKGRSGNDGLPVLEISDITLDDVSVRSPQAVTTLRKSGISDDLIFQISSMHERVAVSNIISQNSALPSGDILNANWASVEVTTNDNKDIGRWNFSPSEFDPPRLELPDWTPTGGCIDNIRYAQTRLNWWNFSEESVPYTFLEEPVPDCKNCASDFFFCPNLGDFCDIKGGLSTENVPHRFPEKRECLCPCPIEEDLQGGGKQFVALGGPAGGSPPPSARRNDACCTIRGVEDKYFQPIVMPFDGATECNYTICLEFRFDNDMCPPEIAPPDLVIDPCDVITEASLINVEGNATLLNPTTQMISGEGQICWNVTVGNPGASATLDISVNKTLLNCCRGYCIEITFDGECDVAAPEPDGDDVETITEPVDVVDTAIQLTSPDDPPEPSDSEKFINLKFQKSSLSPSEKEELIALRSKMVDRINELELQEFLSEDEQQELDELTRLVGQEIDSPPVTKEFDDIFTLDTPQIIGVPDKPIDSLDIPLRPINFGRTNIYIPVLFQTADRQVFIADTIRSIDIKGGPDIVSIIIEDFGLADVNARVNEVLDRNSHNISWTSPIDSLKLDFDINSGYFDGPFGTGYYFLQSGTYTVDMKNVLYDRTLRTDSFTGGILFISSETQNSDDPSKMVIISPLSSFTSPNTGFGSNWLNIVNSGTEIGDGMFQLVIESACPLINDVTSGEIATHNNALISHVYTPFGCASLNVPSVIDSVMDGVIGGRKSKNPNCEDPVPPIPSPPLVSVCQSTISNIDQIVVGEISTITGTNLETTTSIVIGNVVQVLSSISSTTVKFLVHSSTPRGSQSLVVSLSNCNSTSTIVNVTANSIINTECGNPDFLDSGEGGPAWDSGYSGDGNICILAEHGFDPDGYNGIDPGSSLIAEHENHVIREVDSENIITTIAGTGSSGFSGDNGLAVNAELDNPRHAVKDALGNIFISDSGNFRIRKIDQSGIISTICGDGTNTHSGDGGSASSAQISLVFGMAFDSSGNLYIAEAGNGKTIRKLSAISGEVTGSSTITTIAGDGSSPTDANPPVNGVDATLSPIRPQGDIVFDSDDNLFYADTVVSRIRRIDASTNVITTIAGIGTGGPTGSGDGAFSGDGGAATSAELNFPSGLILDGNNDIFFSDTSNHRIRKIDISTGIITTVVGGNTDSIPDDEDAARVQLGDGGNPINARIEYPSGLMVKQEGLGDVLLIVDGSNQRIRRVTDLLA